MPVVSPTDPEPRFHLSLTDGTDILSFVLYGIDNKRAPDAINRFPVVQSALKTAQGEGKYSDLQFPYTAVAQDTYSGGFGEDEFEENKMAYFDGEFVNTSMEKGFFLAGLPQYGRGYGRTMFMNWPDATNLLLGWLRLSTMKDASMTRYATKVTADETGTINFAEIEWEIEGSPTGNFTLDIMGDSLGFPDESSRIGGAQTFSVEEDTDPESRYAVTRARQPRRQVSASFTSGPTVTSGTAYWVVLDFSGVTLATGDEVWLLGIQGHATGTVQAYIGSTWANDTVNVGLAFMCYEDVTDFKAHFFEYKNNLYFVKSSIDGSTASDLYMAGYRGCADDNSGDPTYLVDATAPFTGLDPRAEVENMYVKLTAGPGSTEEQPWRRISGSTTTQILGEKIDWQINHTTDTEYVVEGGDRWSLIDDGAVFTKPVTDVAVVNDMVLFAQGSGNPTVAHREYNEEGVWTNTGTTCWREISPEGGDFIAIQHDYKLGKQVWLAQNGWQPNQYGAWVRRDNAPKQWSDSLFLWGGTIEPVTAAWSEYVHPDVAVTYAENRMKIDFAGDYTASLVTTQAISSTDLTQMTKLKVTVNTNKDMSAGGLQFLLDNTALCASPLVTISAPAMRKDIDYDLVIDVDTENIDMTQVISVGIQLTEDKGGDHNLYIKSPIQWVIDHDPIECGKFDLTNITGIEIYDDPERLYVFTEGEVGYISGDKYNAVPLREMKSLRSSYNGRAHDVGGVYLYFGLGPDGRVQQYFRQTLNDMGPARTAGLREDRRGPVSAILTYPGDRLFIAIDGGRWNHSSILMFAQGGWTEVFRSRHTNKRIHSLHVQSLAGESQQKLWFCMDGFVMWIPITFNPRDEQQFLYNWSGSLVTSWMYMNFKDLNKLFKEVKLFSEDLAYAVSVDGPNNTGYRVGRFVNLDYIADATAATWTWRGLFYWDVDNDTKKRTEDAWTAVTDGGGRFTGSPVQTLTLGTAGVAGRRLMLRFNVYTTTLTTSPYVEASVVKGYAIQDVKYGYAFTTKLTEGDLSIDLEGDEVNSANYATTVEAALAKMDAWSLGVTPLTLNAIYSPFDGKSVVINPIPMQPIRAIPDDQVEEQFLQVTVEEV
jgi:hypothetical protein